MPSSATTNQEARESDRAVVIPGSLSDLAPSVMERFDQIDAGDHYLMKQLPQVEWPRLCARHHNLLFERFGPAILRQMFDDTFCLWWVRLDGRTNRINLRKTRYNPEEGELSLDLIFETKRIATIGFNLAPGSLFGASEPAAAIITRVQGIPERQALIQAASVDMNAVAGTHALMAALAGVCEALGVHRLIGCPAGRQVKFADALAPVFHKNYDDFFLALGATAYPEGFFGLSVPLPEKPITAVKRGHRIRTRLKRAIKQHIRASAREAVEQQREAELLVCDRPGAAMKDLLARLQGAEEARAEPLS